MSGHTKVGDLWSGNISWTAGQGGTPGTSKMIGVLSAANKTLQGLESFPTAHLTGQIPTEDLDDWDHLSLWMKVTKSVHTVNIAWAASPILYVYGHANDEVSTPANSTTGLYPATGHWPIYVDTAVGTTPASLTKGGARFIASDCPSGNNSFPDDAGNGSVFGSFFHIAANPYSGKIKPFKKVSAIIQLTPNVAIAGTNTFAVQFRWIYSRGA